MAAAAAAGRGGQGRPRPAAVRPERDRPRRSSTCCRAPSPGTCCSPRSRSSWCRGWPGSPGRWPSARRGRSSSAPSGWRRCSGSRRPAPPPTLQLAGTGAKFADDSRARRVPRLRLADARSKSFVRTGPAGSGTAPPALGRRAGRQAELRALRQRAPAAGGPARRGRTPKLNFLHSGTALRSASARRPSRPHPEAQLRRPVARDHAAPPPAGPGQGLDPRRPAQAAGGQAGRGRVRPPARRSRRPPRRPKAGWLRTDAAPAPPTAKRAQPGKGWLRKSRRPRANWYSSGPSTGWVRRSRSQGPVADPASVAVRRAAVQRP